MELVNGGRYSQEDKALIFIYDKLMLKEYQKILETNMDFVSFGYVRGKLYNFSKKTNDYRYFLKPMRRTLDIVYGAIFVINNWEWDKLKLCSFYNNSIPFNGETIQSDIFDLKKIDVVPIKFSSIKEFTEVKYEVGESIECHVFIGNENNEDIKKWTNFRKKNKYYDKSSFYKKVIELN